MTFQKTTINRRRLLQTGTASAVGLLAAPAIVRAQTTVSLTFATGFPPVLPWVREATETFMPRVNTILEEQGSDLTVDWTVALSGTLASVNEMMRATGDGLCDVALLAPIFESTNLPLDNIGFVTPFTVPTHQLAARLINAMHAELPMMTETWARQNIVHLASISNDPYVLMSKFPIETLEDMQNEKMAGAGMNLPWLAGAGAVAVGTNFATFYNDMASGVFDGGITFPSAAASVNLHEICEHLTQTRLGAVSTLAFGANADVMARVPDQVRAAILQAARDASTAYEVRIDGLQAASYDTFAEAGVEVVALTDEQNQAWADRLPPLASEWAEGLAGRGIDGEAAVAFYIDWLRSNDVGIIRDWTQG